MSEFYGKAYKYKGKIVGVCRFLCSKLYVIGMYDPQTKEYTRYRPMFTDAEEGQTKLDEFAQEEGLEEVHTC